MGKKIGKNISKNLSSKYIPGRLAVLQKLLGHAKQSEKDAFKIDSKKAIQKIAEATDDKSANKITRISKSS